MAVRVLSFSYPLSLSSLFLSGLSPRPPAQAEQLPKLEGVCLSVSTHAQ